MSASIITSVVTGGTNSAQTVSEELNAFATDFVVQGCWGTITMGSGSTAGTGSFAVSQDASPDMGVTVASGVAYVSGTPSGQDAQVLRARMTSNYTSYTINANSTGSTKYDWIYLQLNATNANTPDSAKDNVINLYTSRSSSNTADNGSPPTYGILLAVVTVANGASSITNSNISDRRTQAQISPTNSGLALSQTGWNALGYSVSYGANNGNKEFTVTSANDLTGLISPGMKFQITRSTTPPTQCMSFTASSSQYASKSSPSGITFTSAFTCEAWIYLNSYTGQNQVIVGRTDASTGGFAMRVNSSGQVDVFYGASSAFTVFTTYQSVPLNRWVHIAGAVSSVASKTASIYINGALATSSTTVSSATTLTQTSNLSVGAAGAGVTNTFFNGYISEARVWSVAQTQANIQSNMAINLTGSETNLVALFQGNGNFNDSTSNANNLTASGGAIATQAANPYNATEYAIVTSISYSSPTTTMTLFTGTNSTIPNQTLNTPQYSSANSPYGFPAYKGAWKCDVKFKVQTGTTVNNTTAQLTGAQISLPTGKWKLGFHGYFDNTNAGTTFLGATIGLSTATNSLTDDLDGVRGATPTIAASSAETDGFMSVAQDYSVSSQITIYMNSKTSQNNTIYYATTNSSTPTYIEAECSYV